MQNELITLEKPVHILLAAASSYEKQNPVDRYNADATNYSTSMEAGPAFTAAGSASTMDSLPAGDELQLKENVVFHPETHDQSIKLSVITLKPMKRTKTLVAYSHEHKDGLLHVWKIRQGIKMGVDPKRLSNYIVWYYRQYLETHFRHEHRNILSILPPAHPFRVQSREDFIYITRLYLAILDKNSINDIERYIKLLEANIHFEEKTVFEYLQRCFSPQLDALETETPRVSRSQAVENQAWEDCFWQMATAA